MPMTIATVCARGGSKGLPGKNIRDFAGRPLIAHTVAQALASGAVQAVYVSTDDEAIAEAARTAGAAVPFMRPAALATDAAPKLPVIEHLVQHLEQQNGQAVDRIVDLQPTSPLRRPADIAAAVALSAQAGLVLSVSEVADNPYFSVVELAPDGHLHLSKGTGAARRQDLPAVYALNGSIYVWHRSALAQAAQQGLWSVPSVPYVMPRWQSVDIDDLDDFELALWQLGRHREQLGW